MQPALVVASIKPDPVYLEDQQVFYNQLMEESSQLKKLQQLCATSHIQMKQQHERNDEQGVERMDADNDHDDVERQQPKLHHSLLNWMLDVCDHQSCQDQIYPLATMILDKFLLYNQLDSPIKIETDELYCDEEDELYCCEEDDSHDQLFRSCPPILDHHHRSHKQQTFEQEKKHEHEHEQHQQQVKLSSQSRISGGCCSRSRHQSFSQPLAVTNIKPDPVYLEDDKVFYNLLLKESSELRRRQQLASCMQMQHQDRMDSDDLEQQPLNGQQRHSLLSWMLDVCEHQSCQDEIFPLATMILDKFLLYHPPTVSDNIVAETGQGELYCQELRHRRLYLFAACALLLATKSRQTPRLYIQTLIEFSKSELPIELNREEILDGELLILATLKWDIAALVTPNDFIAVILSKCQSLLVANPAAAEVKVDEEDKLQTLDNKSSNDTDNENISSSSSNKHGSRVKRHTQTLLELCLMDSQLSLFSPSILAMASVAVAIDGLSMTEKTCWRLEDIVTNIHEATHKVNELKLMIEVAFQIEKYVQKLLNSAHDD